MVTKVSKLDDGFLVETKSGESYQTRAVILANGVRLRWLDVPGEKEFLSKGVCYSAVSYAPLFIDRVTSVYGEGMDALRSAAELATVASEVHLIGPSEVETALDSVLGNKLKNTEKVKIHAGYKIVRITGDDYANHVSLEGPDGQPLELDTECVFVEKDLVPNTEYVQDLVALDKHGRVIIDSINQTNVPGVFAAGDITNIYAEQVLVAVGEGAKAALTAYDYLLRYK